LSPEKLPDPFLLGANDVIWLQDAQAFPLTNNDLEQLPKWLDEQKLIHQVLMDDDNTCGSPEELNDKQFLAFAIVWDFLRRAASEPRLDMVEPFLLNISGAAGTGKSFWLNTIKAYAKAQGFPKGFVRAAAPALILLPSGLGVKHCTACYSCQSDKQDMKTLTQTNCITSSWT